MKTPELEDFLTKYIYENKTIKYICPRFQCGGYAEMDVSAVNSSDYILEYELKISRSDFTKEKNAIENKPNGDKQKRIKHKYMKYVYKNKSLKKWKTKIKKIPNRYYIVCPLNMIKIEEVPDYSGLIYVDNDKYIEIKKAPLLHKEKINTKTITRFAKTLCERQIYNGKSQMTYKINEMKNR